MRFIWDTTYACPLRCTHCYSESGRRPARQLSPEQLLQVAEAVLRLAPTAVSISGGEPLGVPGLLPALERLRAAGIPVALYTSGFTLAPAQLPRLAQVLSSLHLSVDGASAEVHDRVRGRVGAFEKVMASLSLLDAFAREQRAQGRAPLRFGVEVSVLQSNLRGLGALCAQLGSTLPELSFLAFGAAVPSGLASRAAYAEQELLDDAQLALLADPAFAQSLRELVPASVELSVSTNLGLMMAPPADGAPGDEDVGILQMEPDGALRAFPLYEGTVGNVLTDAPALLLERVRARRRHPLVREALRDVRGMQAWARATRQLDLHFGTDADRERIARRPAYPSSAAQAG